MAELTIKQQCEILGQYLGKQVIVKYEFDNEVEKPEDGFSMAHLKAVHIDGLITVDDKHFDFMLEHEVFDLRKDKVSVQVVLKPLEALTSEQIKNILKIEEATFDSSEPVIDESDNSSFMMEFISGEVLSKGSMVDGIVLTTSAIKYKTNLIERKEGYEPLEFVSDDNYFIFQNLSQKTVEYLTQEGFDIPLVQFDNKTLYELNMAHYE